MHQRREGAIFEEETCFAINCVCSLRVIDGHADLFFSLILFVCMRAVSRSLVVIIKLKLESGRDSSHELFNRVNRCTVVVLVATASLTMRAPIFKRMPMNTFSISMADVDDDDGTRRASHLMRTRNTPHTCMTQPTGGAPTGCCCLICYSHCVTKNNCMI